MRKLYTYTGTVSGFCYHKIDAKALPYMDLELWDSNDIENKAPVLIKAHGGLADYIKAIESTDAEERYLTATWFYDSNLYLYRIEIPSTDPLHPSKIIAVSDVFDREATIFGPADYIETTKPEPMTREQVLAWSLFHADSMNKTGWR